MYTHDEYLYGWVFYLLGVLVVMGCGWLLTARIKWLVIRHMLRVVVGVTLLVPWFAAPELGYLAPAWLIAVFEGLFEHDGSFWRAGTPLITAMVSVSFLYLSLFGLWQLLRREQ